MIGTRTILGLAVDELGVAVAEAHLRGGRAELRRAGHWVFDERLTSDNAKDLGHKLRQFLRANHFAAKLAIVGIPTKWVVTKEIVAPPAGPDALAGLLTIQAERAFSLNASELIFDYSGRASATEKNPVILWAARRQNVDQLKDLAEAAGLHLQAVTVSSLAFSTAQAGPDPHHGLYLRPTYGEFWSQANGRLRSVKHVPLAATDGTPEARARQLASTLQRLILLSSPQDQTPPHHVALYDSGTLSAGVLDRLNAQLAPQITVTDGRPGLLGEADTAAKRPEEAPSIAAVAMAVAAGGTDRPRVDFLNPRIGHQKTSQRKRIIAWAAFAAVVCLVGLGTLVMGWHQNRSDIADYTQQLEMMSEDITAAQEMVDRVKYARSWTSQEPRFLDCLRELTLAFPEEPRIWATNLALSAENTEGQLVGRAVDEGSFYEVLDRIKQNPAFSGVQMNYIRDAGRDSRDKEFAVKFIFQGLE